MQFEYSIMDLENAAKLCWQAAGKATVLAFHGPVGAGKTTLIHALCDAKKVIDTVGSPTFSIINEYFFTEYGKEYKIYHIDLYRLRDEQEAILAGIEECLFDDHICLVEWPEKIAGLLPEDTIHVYMEVVDLNIRRLRIED